MASYTREPGSLARRAASLLEWRHHVDRQIRLGHGTPEVSEQRKAVALRQPGIRHGDQQVHIGVGPAISAGPGTEQTHISSRDQLANAGNHARQPRLDRLGGCGGSHDSILTAIGFARLQANHRCGLDQSAQAKESRCGA
jgi:hypothetical protein